MTEILRSLFSRTSISATIALAAACKTPLPADRVRVSGQIEATDVQVASQVPG